MPFYLYDRTAGSNTGQYILSRRPGKVKLSGNTGPLARYQVRLNPGAITPWQWHAAASDLLAEIPGTTAGQIIVIDLKPTAKENVSLYELLDVWGFSYDGWTPLALRLKSLFIDRSEPKPEEFKSSFQEPVEGRSLVGEFLYVLGGTKGGKWTWGQVGRVNGALLWKDAFTYLTGQLNQALG